MTGLSLRECPVFPPFQRASLAFAFQVHCGDEGDVAQRTAYRISHMHDAILGIRPGLDAAQRERAQRLIEESRSFLDDITTGGPGTNGRPLLLSAEARSSDDSPQTIVLNRPESWAYQFEGTDVALRVTPPRRRLELTMHEHFCIFESGRMFYLLVLANLPDRPSPFDEYSTIQAQQLVIDRHLAADESFLSIGDGGDDLSLMEFVRTRLAALDRAPDATAPDQATAIGDVLRPFGILAEGRSLRAPRTADLCNAMVQVEDELLFETARHAFIHYRMDSPESAVATDEAKPHPGWIADADREWHAANVPADDCDCDAHHPRGFGPDAAASPIPRQLLAFAGMSQGVPDFPRQDDSEIHDSTRPVSVAPENLFFVHPAFTLDVGKNWRTLREGQEVIGACPYALLTWMIGVHDELLVAEMERLIEEMIFGQMPGNAPATAIGRAVPLQDLGKAMVRIASPLPSQSHILDTNLSQRIDIFRWCTIHQAGNIFRYPTERELLQSIREARGTKQRFEDAHAVIDRYENLVEDVTTLRASYSDARTNWMLAAITVFGIAQLPSNMESAGLPAGTGLLATLILLLVTAALFALWLNATQLKRSRKSSYPKRRISSS